MKRKNYGMKLKGLKNLFLLVILISATITLTGCSSDDDESFVISLDGPVISVSDFTGNWDATQADFIISANPLVLFDVLDEGGSVSFNVQSNGRFTITIKVPNRPDESFSGRLGFNEEYGSNLIVLFDGDAPEDYEVYIIELQSGQLRISGPAAIDVEGDGMEVETTADLIFIRS